MGIIIAVAVIIAAVFFTLRYRPQGVNAMIMFGVCIFAGVVMSLAVDGLSSWLFYLAEAAICSLLVLGYRYEARRQAAERAQKLAAKRAERKAVVIQLHERKPLSCFAAFTDSVGEAA